MKRVVPIGRLAVLATALISTAALETAAAWMGPATGAMLAAAAQQETLQPVEAAAQATGAPQVEITKRCPQLRYLGREATFEITVTNRGSGAAHDVTVTDVIDGGLQFISADNSGQRQGNNIVWRLGTLEAGQSRVLQARFGCNTIGRVRNTATVAYCAQAAASCEMEVRGIPAILLECVDDPDPVEVGTNTTYTIVVVNQGSAVGTNIRIVCTLPPEQELVSADGPTRSTSEGKRVSFEPLDRLPAGARATYKVVVRGVGTGDVRFAVELLSDQVTAPVNETESTHIYE